MQPQDNINKRNLRVAVDITIILLRLCIFVIEFWPNNYVYSSNETSVMNDLEFKYILL